MKRVSRNKVYLLVFSHFQIKYLVSSNMIMKTNFYILTHLWFSFLGKEAMSLNNYVMSDLYTGSFILWLAVETYGINMSLKCNCVRNS